jgi:hypothetical protein
MCSEMKCPLCGGQVVTNPDALTVEAGGERVTLDFSEDRCQNCGADMLEMSAAQTTQEIKQAASS